MRARALFAVALAFAHSLSLAAGPALGGERVVASTPVPDAARKVGVVRLLQRDGAVVAQTLLSTKLLARATGEIRRKEEANWPVASEGRADADRYLAALERVRAEVEARGKPTVDWQDRRRRLLIEFVADEERARVLVGTFEVAGAASDPEPASGDLRREVLAELDLSRAYVLSNIRLILADSFHIPEDDVDSLGPLGAASKERTPHP